jgi:hypothetical protein
MGLSVFLCVAAFFLVAEHWAHVIPYLPFVLLLLCPVMHFDSNKGLTKLKAVRSDIYQPGRLGERIRLTNCG